MPRLFASVSLMLLFAVLPMASAVPEGEVNCRYFSDGVTGALAISNAPGLPYFAMDTGGALVSSGQVTSHHFFVPVIGAAPGPLVVHVGGELLLVASTDRSSDWQ